MRRHTRGPPWQTAGPSSRQNVHHGAQNHAMLAGAIFVATAALIGLLAPNTRTVTTTPGIDSNHPEVQPVG